MKIGPSHPCASRAAVLALLSLAYAAPAVCADESGVQAIWKEKKVTFTYMGFTAKYSCDGLRDRMKEVLLQLGARSDLKVYARGCSNGFGRPTPFPGVSGTINVLEPLGDSAPAPDAPPVAAHWSNVEIRPKGDPLKAAGECELTEQIKESILPLFSTRNVVYSSTCVPNQLQVGGTKLSADVLIADPQPGKPPGVKPR